MKIFFCHRGALGDFLMTWPLLDTMRKLFPKHEFFFAGRPEYLDFAKSKALLDAWINCESASLIPFFSGEAVPERISKNLMHAILWMRPDAKIKRSFAEFAGVEPLFIDPFPEKMTVHVSEYYYAEASKRFSLPPYKKQFEINSAKKKGTLPCRSDYFIVHPGSGSQKKNMPPIFFKRLAKRISARTGLSPRFVFGNVETENGLPGKFAEFACEFPANLFELENLLEGAALYAGNDSGASHLASILGLRCLVFYIASDPIAWGTIGPRSKNIKYFLDHRTNPNPQSLNPGQIQKLESLC